MIIIKKCFIDAVAKDFMTESDVAEYFGVTKRTIFNWRKTANLPVHFLGNKPLYLKSEIMRWFVDRHKKPKK